MYGYSVKLKPTVVLSSSQAVTYKRQDTCVGWCWTLHWLLVAAYLHSSHTAQVHHICQTSLRWATWTAPCLWGPGRLGFSWFCCFLWVTSEYERRRVGIWKLWCLKIIITSRRVLPVALYPSSSPVLRHYPRRPRGQPYGNARYNYYLNFCER